MAPNTSTKLLLHTQYLVRRILDGRFLLLLMQYLMSNQVNIKRGFQEFIQQ